MLEDDSVNVVAVVAVIADAAATLAYLVQSSRFRRSSVSCVNSLLSYLYV